MKIKRNNIKKEKKINGLGFRENKFIGIEGEKIRIKLFL
jgi:hypothetical protein